MIAIAWCLALLLMSQTRAHSQDTSCGVMWEEPILLSDSAYDASSPQIAVTDDATIHVTWEGGRKLPYRRSTDGGRSFEPLRDLLTDTIRFPFQAVWERLVASGNRVYIFSIGGDVGLADTPIRMLLSHDAGTTWDSIRNINNDTTGVITSAAICGDTLALVFPPTHPPRQSRQITVSPDGGLTWRTTRTGLDYFSSVALTPNTLHLLHDVGGINRIPETHYLRSQDAGITMVDPETLSTNDGFGSHEHSVAGFGPVVTASWRDAKLGCLGLGFSCSIIERTSTDNGITWGAETILTETPNGLAPAMATQPDNTAVAWMEETVYNTLFHVVVRLRSDSSGWCPKFTVGEGTYPAIALSSNAIHVVWERLVGGSLGTYRAYYRRCVFLPTGVDERPPRSPQGLTLRQNYPNPFNPTTVLLYTLAKSEWVTLKVYDVFGREVETLVNARKQAGEYTVEWTAENISSGTYFFRIAAGQLTQTKKALLIR